MQSIWKSVRETGQKITVIDELYLKKKIQFQTQDLLDPTCPQPLCKNGVVNIAQMANSEASFEEELNFVQFFFFWFCFFCNNHR